jgi:hypothetical protein
LDTLTSPDAAPQDRPRLTARGGKLIVSAVVTAALLVPGAAAAQASSPTSAQYDTQAQFLGQQAQAATANSNDPSVNDPIISGLPFTGVDVALLGIVALALIGAGFALQRLSRPAGPDERA